ncbi:MAG: hypothetical protein PHQ40_02200 [Anaerolineaceae bacterium]|nr:hypothetical protein [Anaerolineaceae bacterium]
MNTIAFRSLPDLAHALRQESLGISHRGLTARPWNFYNPERNPWYLLRTTQWPAYPFPKLCLRFEELEGKLFTSFYVEKGFGVVAALANPHLRDRGWIMDSTWSWHTIVQQISTVSFLSAAREVLQANGYPLMVKVGGTYTTGMEILEDGDEWPYENIESYCADHSAGRLWFDMNEKGELTCREVRNLRDEMEPLYSSQNLVGLAAAANQKGRLDWVWIDLEIGVLFDPEPEGDWSAAEVWQRLLSPWLPWVK